MKKNLPDVDIDVKDRVHALDGHSYVSASILAEDELKKHNTGVFYQDIPKDPITGLSAFPSGKKGGDLSNVMGYMKIDVIPNHAYDLVRDPDHLDRLLNMDVDWGLFLREDVVSKLHQLSNHFEIVDAYEPKSINDLACLIAIIRPGKRHLLGMEWEDVRREIWKPEADGSYSYKKSHAVAFATCIVVQLNSMIDAGLIT